MTMIDESKEGQPATPAPTPEPEEKVASPTFKDGSDHR